MKIKFLLLFTLFNLTLWSQVGVGTTTPQGALDVSSSTNGLIPPRVALTATNVELPVVNPQGGAIIAGTTVYNTATVAAGVNSVAPGLYYWNGTKWVAFAGSPGGLDWTLTGNSFTSPGTNFLGTTDAQDLVFKTTDSERARILSGGHFIVGASTNYVGSGVDNIFEVQSIVDGEEAISGYSTGTGIGVWGLSTGLGVGILGVANGESPSSYAGSGVSGSGSDTGTAGMAKTVATGVGVRGNGNGVSTNTTSGVGAGVAGSGTQVGVFGHASNTTGTKNGGVFTSEHGAAGTADNPYAYLAGTDGTNVYGGYFDANQDNNGGTQDYAYVGTVNGGTTYKILGAGSVSTIVKDENNERRIMFCPESPEILFQDYGTGKLENGIARITIDPILAKNIFVDTKHPLKVFIQLEGDCNGVFVTNKSENGFTVTELKNGKSNTEFSWQIVATRADMLDSQGKVHSKHVDVRFPIGPGPIKHREEVKTEVIKADNNKIK